MVFILSHPLKLRSKLKPQAFQKYVAQLKTILQKYLLPTKGRTENILTVLQIFSTQSVEILMQVVVKL